MRHTGLAHLLRLLTPLFLLVVNPAALGADSLRGPNIVLTSDAPGVRVEGAFERIRARQSRSAAVLQAVGGGIHRVLFNAAPGVSGYYRVLLWWPQVRGAADVVVDGLNGRAATRVDPGLRSGQWVAAGVFALPADHAQIEVSAPAGMRLFVDALRLQYVGDAPPPPSFGVTAIPVAIAGVQYAAVLEIVDGTTPLAFPVSAVNNGERKGAVWGADGGWNVATANAYPDDVQIDFNGSKTIDRVVVYTLQDNYSSPMEPTDTLMFSAYGVTAFTVEGWERLGLDGAGQCQQQQPGEADGDVRALQHQRDPNPSDAGTRPIFASD